MTMPDSVCNRGSHGPPYLRVIADAGRTTGPFPRDDMKQKHSPPRGFAGVSWALWGAFVASIALLAVVRTYVNRNESRWEAPTEAVAALPVIEVRTPGPGVAANALRLEWDEVPDAAGYQLHLTSITGAVVADGLPVDETWWSPPEELLPALVKGEYLWNVTALDAENAPIARSAPEVLRILY
jgi:hypothetical protein